MAADILISNEKNSSGIPKAVFLEDVDAFMSSNETMTADMSLKHLEEQHSKYKYMEHNLSTKKNRLKSQIPELKSSLNLINYLESIKDSDEPLETHYQLNNSLFAKAKIPPTEKVCLWLGANVMLEYSLSEAKELLTKNQEAAVKALNHVDEDLCFIRDQTTTIEVNMARIYNWDVKRRQKEKIVS